MLEDARRGEYFVRCFSNTKEPTPLDNARLCSVDELGELSEKGDILFLSSTPQRDLDIETVQPARSIAVGALLAACLKQSLCQEFSLEAVTASEPVYLREVAAKSLKERGVMGVDFSPPIE